MFKIQLDKLADILEPSIFKIQKNILALWTMQATTMQKLHFVFIILIIFQSICKKEVE